MAVEERDPHTGYLTTGHEWNGIKELNTPVPRAVYFFLIADGAVRRRLLGADAGLADRHDLYQGPAGHRSARIVSESLKQAALDRAAWTEHASRRDASRTSRPTRA